MPTFSSKAYKANLDTLASLIVARLNKSRRRGEGVAPRVLCIGNDVFKLSVVSGEQSLSSMSRICYVVSSPNDTYENTRAVVERLETGIVQYEEPLWDCSDNVFGEDRGLCSGGVKTFQ